MQLHMCSVILMLLYCFAHVSHQQQISMSMSATCSLQFDEFKCWGSEFGFIEPPDDPLNLFDESAPIRILSGAMHHCLIYNFGRVRCFGLNSNGQLGYGDTAYRYPDDTSILDDIDFGTDFYVEDGGAGWSHSCFLSKQSEIKCIGSNQYGQLGYGDTLNRGDDIHHIGNALPVVDLGDGFIPIQLVVGHDFNCVLSLNSTVKCWGFGGHGQLGLGDTENRGDDPYEMGNNLTFVDLGDFVPVLLEAGGYHICAVTAVSDGGSLKCWGYNAFGQLGLEDVNNRGDESNEMGNTLSIIDLGSSFVVKALFCGAFHNCALSTTGFIKCFGRGEYGQLGYGNNNNIGDESNEMGDNLDFVDLGSHFTVSALGMGPIAQHSCAFSIDDDVKCWGLNTNYQLGLGDRNDRGDDSNEMGDDLPYLQIPTPAPTSSIVPTMDPTECVDYRQNYNSSDGVDYSSSDFLDSVPMMNDYSTTNIVVYNSSLFLVDADIYCNQSAADVCFIECDSQSSCFGSNVIPSEGVELEDMVITCTEYRSCRGMTVNISKSRTENVQIFCAEGESCKEMELQISSSLSSSVTVHCNQTRSCKHMDIHLWGVTASEALSVTILCYDHNSCDGLIVETNGYVKNINVTLNVMRWSDAISIYHLYADNVNVHCGSTDDRLYIAYGTSQLLDEDALLDVARKEYTNHRLPCEDITIYCSNNTDFERQCTFEYVLAIDFKSIFNDSNTPDCYWLDLNEVYLADCQGTCGDAMVYNEYPVIFELDIVFEGGEQNGSNETNNVTNSFLICDEYFGTMDDTMESLNSIDVLFESALNVIASTGSGIIHSITSGPYSSLRQGFEVECANTESNVIEIVTNLTIKSAEENSKKIDDLFAPNSDFMVSTAEMMTDFFEIPISLINIMVLDTDILNGFAHGHLFLVGGVVFAFCTLILLLILCIRDSVLRRKTIYIRNAMVIPIGISEYDESMKMSKSNVYLADLPREGIRNDVQNMIQFFGAKLRYDVYPFDVNKFRCTMDELLQFLDEMARLLQYNLLNSDNPYDGLIVSISCHGMKDKICTTDYKSISKQSIHRMFTRDFPENRKIPKIFIFDSCAGTQSRIKQSRATLTRTQLQNQIISKGTPQPSHNITPRAQHVISPQLCDHYSRQDNEDEKMQCRDEENTDYKLAQIDAANPDFTAKMSKKMQASFLTHLLLQALSQNPNRFLFQITGEVQKHLCERGIQLVEHRYNNGTEYIKFQAGKKIEEEEAKEPDANLFRPMSSMSPQSKPLPDIAKKGLAKQDSIVTPSLEMVVA